MNGRPPPACASPEADPEFAAWLYRRNLRFIARHRRPPVTEFAEVTRPGEAWRRYLLLATREEFSCGEPTGGPA